MCASYGPNQRWLPEKGVHRSGSRGSLTGLSRDSAFQSDLKSVMFFRFQISFVKLCSIEETQVKHKLVQFEETFLSISFAVGDSIRVVFSVSILF